MSCILILLDQAGIFQIDNAYATLTLPGDIIEAVCYTGPDGSQEQTVHMRLMEILFNCKA